MKRIESRDNKWVKRLNGLKIKKNREKEGVFVAEGLRFISEVPADWAVEAYAVSDTFANENDLSEYEKKAEVLCLPDALFASVCDTENPQGILAVCKKLNWDDAAVFAKEKPFLYARCPKIIKARLAPCVELLYADAACARPRISPKRAEKKKRAPRLSKPFCSLILAFSAHHSSGYRLC